MKDIYYIGEVFVYPNGTIVRIVERLLGDNKIKLRAVNSCKGEYSKDDRIGQPYTYQFWSTVDRIIKRKVKRIGTEEVLLALFDRRNNK